MSSASPPQEPNRPATGDERAKLKTAMTLARYLRRAILEAQSLNLSEDADHPVAQLWRDLRLEFGVELAARERELGRRIQITVPDDDAMSVSLPRVARHRARWTRRCENQRREAIRQQRRGYEREIRAHRRTLPGQPLGGYAAQCARELPHLGDTSRTDAVSAASPTAQGPRARGAGHPAVKGSARRSSARSGDSGDSDPEDEGDVPPPADDGRRSCVGCGRDISHKKAGAKVCSNRCERRKLRHADPLTDSRDADPYLNLTAGDHKELRDRALAGCRCNGHHILDPDDGTCLKCGRPRDWSHWEATAADRLIRIRAASPECSHERPLEDVVAW